VELVETEVAPAEIPLKSPGGRVGLVEVPRWTENPPRSSHWGNKGLARCNLESSNKKKRSDDFSNGMLPLSFPKSSLPLAPRSPGCHRAKYC
uniref:Uncharacterized protein n=1 Tax=Cannabis sativa TaxID=3483 RepID=A0A803QRN4_CANSA